ncbi:uncharacterized protein LOC108714007 isoform X2 [Xenopus laevis]|uniref:Uncharacterized protein LOC108714007 isoform X2 n=1 Tax=Xenopus laevis TaxID=8355 RepID=A0A8J1MX76_XENLA|nr:uncharacterized protein LOC108714007 isoform X2 [Xenopus laevis]
MLTYGSDLSRQKALCLHLPLHIDRHKMVVQAFSTESPKGFWSAAVKKEVSELRRIAVSSLVCIILIILLSIVIIWLKLKIKKKINDNMLKTSSKAFSMESPKGFWSAAVMKEVSELRRIAVSSLVCIILIILLSIVIVWLKSKIKKINANMVQTSSKAFSMESPKGFWSAAVMKEVSELRRIAVSSLVCIILIILLSIVIVWLKSKIKKINDNMVQTSSKAFSMESTKGFWSAAVMKEVSELRRIAVSSLVCIILIILLSIVIVWLKLKIKKKINDNMVQTSSKDAQTMTESVDEEQELREVLVISPKKTEQKKDEDKEDIETREKVEEKSLDKHKVEDQNEEQEATVIGNLEENEKDEKELKKERPKKKRLKKCFRFLAAVIKKIEGRKKGEN